MLRRRGRDVDLSEETRRGDAAAATWIYQRTTPQVLESDDDRVIAYEKSRVAFKRLFDVCDAVVCSAGNETVWEAVCRGVRVLAVPTKGHAEQVLNAAAHHAAFPALVGHQDVITSEGLDWALAGDPRTPDAVAARTKLRTEIRGRAAGLKATISQLSVQPQWGPLPPFPPDPELPEEPPEDCTASRTEVTVEEPGPVGVQLAVDGRVQGMKPGSAAETGGVRKGDRVIKVGERWTHGKDSVSDAIADHVERPLILLVDRPHPEPEPDPERDRVSLTFDGDTLGIAFCPNGTAAERNSRRRRSFRPILAAMDCGRRPCRSRGVAATGAADRGVAATGPRNIVPTLEKRARTRVVLAGTPGMLAPGGEAERLGVQYSDRVVRVGQLWVEGEDQIKSAVRKHPARPITLVVERKRAAPPPPDPEADGEVDEIELSLADEP